MRELQTAVSRGARSLFRARPRAIPGGRCCSASTRGRGSASRKTSGSSGVNLLGSLPRTLAVGCPQLPATRRSGMPIRRAAGHRAGAAACESCQGATAHALVTYEENGEPDVFPVVRARRRSRPEQLGNLVREGKLDARRRSKELEASRAQLLERAGGDAPAAAGSSKRSAPAQDPRDRTRGGRATARNGSSRHSACAGRRDACTEWLDANVQQLDARQLCQGCTLSPSVSRPSRSRISGGIRSLEVKLLGPRDIRAARAQAARAVCSTASVGEAARELDARELPDASTRRTRAAENLFGSVLGPGGELPSLAQIHSRLACCAPRAAI
jgi:hypothetical protein